MNEEVLIGGIEKREIVIVDYDSHWPEKFQKHAEIIGGALGSKVVRIEHVGSTAAPMLWSGRSGPCRSAARRAAAGWRFVKEP